MARQNSIKSFPFRVSLVKALWKRTVLFLITGLFLFGFLSAAAFSQTKNAVANAATASWIGKYDFENVGKSRRRDEIVPSVYYVLEISKGKITRGMNRSSNAIGYQTNEEYKCSVKTADNDLSVYFEKDLIHGDDKEFVQYKKSPLLFSLVKSQTGDKTRRLFRSDNYKIRIFNVEKKAA